MPHMIDGKENVWTVGNARLVGRDSVIDDGLVAIAGGHIVYAGPRANYAGDGDGKRSGEPDVDARGDYICPGFIDIHVHGGGGADVMDGTRSALHTIARSHVRHGTTGFLATTMTAPHERLLPVIAVVREAVAADRGGADTSGARVLGLHLEGPYVNPARAGAQNPTHMRGPSSSELEQLLEAAGDSWRVITLAPELPGVPEAIATLVERDIRVSMGHTAATYAQGKAAIAAGATLLTHTFNAMNPLHHREPGLIGAVLDDGTVFAEVIADGLHVHPLMMRLLYRLKGAEGIVLVTDAIRAQGCGDGEYTLGDLTVTVRDNEARLHDTGAGATPGALAGSLLTMDAAVRTMVHQVGVPLHEAVRMASYNPAAAIGLTHTKGSLERGKDADIVVLDDALQVQKTVVAGRIVYSR